MSSFSIRARNLREIMILNVILTVAHQTPHLLAVCSSLHDILSYIYPISGFFFKSSLIQVFLQINTYSLQSLWFFLEGDPTVHSKK